MTQPLKYQPAFPTDGISSLMGLSKLEYFAAAAMQGLMRHPDCVGEREEVVAAWAIAAAKALLDELEKEKQ